MGLSYQICAVQAFSCAPDLPDVYKRQGQIRADDIERPLVSLQEEGYAARTINFYRSTVHQIMQRAVGRVISSNPVDLVQLTEPGQKAEQRRALSAEEQKWIWETPHLSLIHSCGAVGTGGTVRLHPGGSEGSPAEWLRRRNGGGSVSIWISRNGGSLSLIHIL